MKKSSPGEGQSVLGEITMRDPDGVLLDDTSHIQAALDAMDDLFYVFDTDNHLVAWNTRFGEVTGYTDEELYELPLTAFVRDQDQSELQTHLEEVAETGQSTVQLEIQTKSNATISYELYVDTLTNDAGEVISHVGIGRDVTERVEYRRALERETSRLEEFASTLAHDLRNPLNVAQARLAIVTNNFDDESDAYEHLQTVDDAHSRIEQIISDVLELGKSGDLIADPEPVPLGELSRDVWSDVEHGAATLTIEDYVAVRADRSLLKRMVTNLLRNAVEHGGDDVDVWVGELSKANGFYVADNGPGIAPDEQEHVFDWKHSTKESGFGVGLQSVQRVCEAHGWEITVTESRADGARFEVAGITTPT